MLCFMSGSKQLTIKTVCVDEDPGWREAFLGPGIVWGVGLVGVRAGRVDEFPLPRFLGGLS